MESSNVKEINGLLPETQYNISFFSENVQGVFSVDSPTIKFTTNEPEKPVVLNFGFEEFLSDRDKNYFLCELGNYLGLPVKRFILDGLETNGGKCD